MRTLGFAFLLAALGASAGPASAAGGTREARAAASSVTPPDGASLQSSGIDKFFAGDLPGAADDWAAGHGASDKTAGELAVLALTILTKESLRRGDLLSAGVYSTHGLEVSPKDRVLQELLQRAEEDRRLERRSSKEGLDASKEQETLISRVLRIDVSSPRLSPGPEGPREGQGSAALLRQVFAEDKSFKLDRLLQSVQRDEEALRTADRARLSQAWRRRRARYCYEQGLPAYYAGDFETAARWFRQATQLDPNLKEARSGLKGCEAALGKGEEPPDGARARPKPAKPVKPGKQPG